MSKAEIAAAEQQQQDLLQRKRTNDLQVDQKKAMVRERRRARIAAQEALAAAKVETAKLKTVESQTRQRLADCHAERDALAKELAECEKELEAERAEVVVVKATKKGLVLAQSALGDVHEELIALSSDEAKKAALEAEGGELPTDLVPAPMVYNAEPVVDSAALWNEDSARPMRDEVRQACQSELVLVALQKSLSVRAADLREGLRQLGFARGATNRTEELCRVARGDHSGNESKCAELRTEQDQIAAEHKAELGSLTKLRADHQALQQQHAALLDTVKGVDGAIDLLRQQRREMREQLEASKLEHEELTRAHEDAGREVEAMQTALQEHPDEAARRTSAAERLARMAEDQTHRSLEELQQTQEQLISFQQAHRAMQQVYAVLGEQLEAERKAASSLKAQHERQNLELSALARNYMAALPPLPGLEKLAEEPDPPPAPVPAEQTVPLEEAERAAIGRTPEPPQQPRHLDPTGLGALSAGGRLVLSI